MSQNPYDQLSKQLLEELLSPLGRVDISREVLGESRFVDVWFDPDPISSNTSTSDLGLLGRIAATPCLIEPFRNALSSADLDSCLLKLFAVIADWRRQRNRNPDPQIASAVEPRLWILTPTASRPFLAKLGARPIPNWPEGAYLSVPAMRASIIAIHQLPHTPETVWLRLLGKGKVQRQAIEELVALPRTTPWRASALRMLASWRITIEVQGNAASEDRELAMALSQAFIELEKEIEQRGERRGEQRGREDGKRETLREVIENMARMNFDEAQIAKITGLSAEHIRTFLEGR
ncbi:MAG: flagellar assembly protein H [Cyanobacteria bacterium J06639_1]